jgi:hypothetical protein
MSTRFDYVKYDEIAMTKQCNAKNFCTTLESFIEQQLPNGRAKSLALTKLEEVYMWIGKAIRDEQVEQRIAVLQEERSNE